MSSPSYVLLLIDPLNNLKAVSFRYFLDTLRKPSLTRAKLLQKFIMALFIGLLYFQVLVRCFSFTHVRRLIIWPSAPSNGAGNSQPKRRIVYYCLWTYLLDPVHYSGVLTIRFSAARKRVPWRYLPDIQVRPLNINSNRHSRHQDCSLLCSYYVARILSYFPLFTIDGLFLLYICYWMIGLSTSAIQVR